MWYYAQADIQSCMQAIFSIVNILNTMNYIFHDTEEQVEAEHYVRFRVGTYYNYGKAERNPYTDGILSREWWHVKEETSHALRRIYTRFGPSLDIPMLTAKIAFKAAQIYEWYSNGRPEGIDPLTKEEKFHSARLVADKCHSNYQNTTMENIFKNMRYPNTPITGEITRRPRNNLTKIATAVARVS